MKKTALFLSMLASAALLPTANAFADTANPIEVSFTNPVQTGTAGATLTFELTTLYPDSKGGTLYLNGDSINVSGANYDDSLFILNAPFTLDPGDSSTFDAFTVTLFSNLPAGVYTGTFTLLGGSDGAAQDNLGSANFEIDIPPAVPEPGSWLLFATGMGAVAVAVYSSRGALQS